MRAYAYCADIDVAAHLAFFKRDTDLVATFLATTIPNATQVARFCHDASNELDDHLRTADFTVPVATTATGAIESLRTWSSVGAAMYAAAAMGRGRAGEHLDWLTERWSAILDSIDQGDVGLAGAAVDTELGRTRFSDSSPSPYFQRASDDVGDGGMPDV